MEINHFEGSGLEWLVLKRKPLSLFSAEDRIWRGRGGNNLLVHACGTNSLFLFSFLSLFFRFFSYLSFFFLSFLLLLVSISWFSSSQSYLLPHSRRCPCTQQGLLFIVSVVTRFYYFSP